APFVLRALTDADERARPVGLPLPATQERGEGQPDVSKERSSSPRPSPPSDGGEGVCAPDSGVSAAMLPVRHRPTPLVSLSELPMLAPLVQKWHELRGALSSAHLSPATAEKLYGRELRTSVSRLEDFAACPFKFFAARGLRLQERKEFQFDDRDKGSFQHEVLC